MCIINKSDCARFRRAVYLPKPAVNRNTDLIRVVRIKQNVRSVTLLKA